MRNVKISIERRERVYDFWRTPEDKRPDGEEFRLDQKLSLASWKKLKFDFDRECRLKKLGNTREVMEEVLSKGILPPKAQERYSNYNSDEWLERQTADADAALLKACESGNAQALKIYYQLNKRLVDKQEVTHLISPDIIERSRKKAEEEFRVIEGKYKELPDKPPELNESN